MAVREAFLAPIAHSCARAGPQLLRLLPGLRGVARLLHAVALAAEPRLTAPVCERLCELADRCRPWRPALPQLTRLLRESLAEGGVPAGQARVRLVLRRGLTGGGMTEGQTASLGSFLDTS
jgi:hypothetical protein